MSNLLVTFTRGYNQYERLQLLLDWDAKTIMGSGSAEHRATTVSFFAQQQQQWVDQHWPEVFSYYEKSTHFQSLCSLQQQNYVTLRERLNKPRDSEWEVAYQEAVSRGQQAWKEARERNSFQHFIPALQRIVMLKKGKFGTGLAGYEAIMQQYEPIDVSTVHSFLDEIQQHIASERVHILDNQENKQRCLHRYVPKQQQLELYREVILAFGLQENQLALGETIHPFMLGIHRTDTRIAPRWNEQKPLVGFLGMLHEAGHALYEQSIAPRFDDTIFSEGASAAIHESVALFYSWVIGLSYPFWEGFYPTFQQKMAPAFDAITLDEFYEAIHQPEYSLNRFEADAMTYPLHIWIRFSIEKDLFEGKLAVEELEEVWNDRYEQLLGIRPATAVEGILQDVHWANGEFGYFPTYTMGHAYALHYYDEMQKELPVDELLQNQQYGPITEWMRTHIFQWGSFKTPDELLAGVHFNELNAASFIKKIQRFRK